MKIYFDGGCRPNPGKMETAVVMRGRLHVRSNAGQGTSEQAEWLSLIHAIDLARAARYRDVLLLGDAASVIDQAVNGARCRSPETRASLGRFEEALRGFDRVRLRHVKRSQNLAGIALGQLREGRRIGGCTGLTEGATE
ncbi:MAG: reverse transcriptase-like protein [Pseudomonadota bacterium]|nr:reverse transcriptase-like protein [Pseudomonadota bacterium]